MSSRKNDCFNSEIRLTHLKGNATTRRFWFFFLLHFCLGNVAPELPELPRADASPGKSGHRIATWQLLRRPGRCVPTLLLTMRYSLEGWRVNCVQLHRRFAKNVLINDIIITHICYFKILSALLLKLELEREKEHV